MPVIRVNGKVIGFLDTKDKIFRKSVYKTKHLFRRLDSWGIDADLFVNVLYPNHYKIQVYDREEDIVYEVDAETFKRKGQYFHFKGDKIDHKAQIFLPRRHWLRISKADQEIRDFYLKYCV